MTITVAVISILAISLAAWLLNRMLPFTVCPICAGVFLTWVGLVSAHVMGYQVDLVVPALLMGGSVVGIMYQLEKKLQNVSPGRTLLFKILFIPAGFVAAYGLLERSWTILTLAVVFLFLVSLAFTASGRTRNSHEETVSSIENKMEDCC
ncbi:MAG: hypothetical protein AAB794_03675 [Patescibacteria group bacterium]